MMPANEKPMKLFNRVTRVLYYIIIIIIIIIVIFVITVAIVIIIPYKKFTQTV